MHHMNVGSGIARNLLAALSMLLAGAVFSSFCDPAIARDASGKGDPEYGAGHTTPHGVKPGRGISGKPVDHGKGGTAHVPGPKGQHDQESHTPTEGDHTGGTGHVPGGKGKGGSGQAGSGHQQDESGHAEGEEHVEGHEPGPKPDAGHQATQ